MAYFFDLEDFETTCRAIGDELLKSVNQDNLANKAAYFEVYKTYDGYKPSQQTIVLNDDGTIGFFVTTSGSGASAIKKTVQYGGYCCNKRLPFYIELAKTKIGVFEGVDTTAIYWDAENQSCRWKKEPEYCALDSFKVVLNAVENDGALFNIDSDDKQCSLTIDFDYLFKMDCQNLVNILDPTMNTNADPKLLAEITNRQNYLEKVKVACSTKSSEIELKSIEFSNTNYSIIACGTNDLYCIQEGEGLTEWSNILGPARYKRFLDGDPNSYTCADWNNINIINNNLINSNKQPIIVKCDTPFGYKSNLQKRIDVLVSQQKACETDIDRMEGILNDLLLKLDIPSTCSTPIEALETLDVSMTLEVVESDGSLSSVFESELFPVIGTGNLYSYLQNHPFDSGFYLCGEPKPTELWASGCTVLKYNDELTGPAVPFAFDCGDRELLGVPADWHCNVESCMVVKDAFLKGLYEQSGLSNSTTDRDTFKASLSKDIFASKWLKFSTVIDDVNILDLIKNKKIKLSLKVNNTCANVCIYIDSIKLIRNCVDGNGKSVLISESPGFQLDRIIDNKKSWIRNSTPVNRTFDVANNEGGNIIRRTDYDVNDERLVINTKEIDLDINIASAIENDVQCYINDNLDLLDGLPSIECGCEYECYKDVFKIITHAEAVAISPEMSIDPEDFLTTIRAMRDAWIKAQNELNLATWPYLDIKDGIYYPNPSEDTMVTYLATRDAYRKAMREFNLASGSGYIEGLTEKPILDDGETIVPMVFNTKCGRILKFPSTMTFNGYGNFYIVETPDKQVKLYTTNSEIAPTDTTWIDLSNIIEEDYPSDWNLTGGIYNNYTPEKREYYCKFFGSFNNHLANIQLSSFHYQTNNNTAHNEWIQPPNEAFYMGWDSSKNKCVTNNFKQVIPEEFSMFYPITDITWTNQYGVYYPCYLDIIARNSGSTYCSPTIDWTWPNIAEDISTVRRAYRNSYLKWQNETFLTNNTVEYYVSVKDPITNKPVDETGGNIAVKVTTTITKGRGGEIAFQEEYILNDSTSSVAPPSYQYGLTRLVIPIGISDPTGYYQNPNSDTQSLYVAGGFGTYITGSTSTMPYPGASANGIDRNWSFYDDVDYYVHVDVVNAATNEVYGVTNNDFNLKDRNLPIKCPSSASTQTFDINSALTSINTYTETVLGQIQEDLDWALDACSCDLEIPPAYTDLRQLDFIDDITRMPSFENLIALPYTSGTVDYSSSATLFGRATEYVDLEYDQYYRAERDAIWSLELQISTGVTVGFSSASYPTLDYTNLLDANFDSNKEGNYHKGKIKKIKNLWWRKASTYSEWTGSTYPLHSMSLDVMLPNVDDFKYLKAIANSSNLPSVGNAGELMLVGTPSSYVGYAWDPILQSWTTGFYDFIFNEILEQRFAQRQDRYSAKRELLLATKPFLWSNEFIPAHGLKQWMYGDAKNFDTSTITGDDVIYNYNNNLPLGLPPEYTVTATTHTIPVYTGNSNNIIY